MAMTDTGIREWLHSGRGLTTSQEIRDCLQELIQHRAIAAEANWRVWIEDGTPQGFRCVGMFNDKDDAYLAKACWKEWKQQDGLVLPFREQPALTAR